MISTAAIDELRAWFLENRRLLPWRGNPSPYQVWVSEVMLQQTQASRVCLFYQRWMERFPTIEALALASEEEVLKYWEGLGYYSRAKALHQAAQELTKNFQAALPSCEQQLLSVKGIGPYTSAAIAAFAFHQKTAAVDGNVVRVLTRLFAISDDISKPRVQRQLRALANTLLPDHEPWVIAEALIELGACVCRPKPECAGCPMQSVCKGYQNNQQQQLPFSSRKTKYESLFREVAVIRRGDHFLLRQGKAGQACAGLFEFPYFECAASGLSSDVVIEKIREGLGLQVQFCSVLDEENHSFTRFRVTLYPKLFDATQERVRDAVWYSRKEIEKLTFSSGHKRILEDMLQFV